MTEFSRQHEAAERVALRRWLRRRDISPVKGEEPNHTELLMKQVMQAGGDPHELMRIADREVDARKATGV